MFHVGSNAGYAITATESLFCSIGLELAGGDPLLVHFAYRNLDRGRPRNLPQQLTNVIALDFKNPENIQRLAPYLEKNKIRLLVIFDIQPVHPLFKVARRAAVQTILAFYGSEVSSLMPWWKLALKKLFFAMSRSKVDGLIFQSQAMADLAIRGRGVPPSMIDVVHTGVDITMLKPAKSDYVYRALGLPSDRKVVVYAGHVKPHKGIHTLVEGAIELLVRRHRSDVCFLICGDTDEQSKEYERRCATLDISSLVCFSGYRRDLAEIFPSCFCGVIPSTGYDSFPRTAIEMAACGLPVVGSRLQGIPEAVLDKETGLLFEPGNAQALADCLEILLERPDLAAEYGKQGRLRCESELNIENQRKRLLTVFRKRLDLTLE
jgi:glycosyltransferase involved in cell wall biosynthesis